MSMKNGEWLDNKQTTLKLVLILWFFRKVVAAGGNLRATKTKTISLMIRRNLMDVTVSTTFSIILFGLSLHIFSL